jgi:alpha-mannosidase
MLPQSKSFASLSAENACWEAFKPAEDGKGFVIRVYETEGRDLEEVSLDLPFVVKKAEEIDFLELTVLGEIKAEKSRIRFPLGHNEIKAIRVFL